MKKKVVFPLKKLKALQTLDKDKTAKSGRRIWHWPYYCWCTEEKQKQN
jgi:hypothetical protein